jgi:hypothetical protein
MERAWFYDLTLHRWLDSDIHDLLARLFFQLLAECCSNLGQAIGEQWGHWRGSLAYHAAPVLAHHKRVSPGSAFAEPERKRHPDAHAVIGPAYRSQPGGSER